MSAPTWSTPIREFVLTQPPTMAGLWSATFTTERMAAALCSAQARPDTDLTEIAMRCADATDHLEAFSRTLADGPWAAPPPLAPPTYDAALASLAGLLGDCLALARRTLGNDQEHLTFAAALALSLVADCLSDAHVRTTGRLR